MKRSSELAKRVADCLLEDYGQASLEDIEYALHDYLNPQEAMECGPDVVSEIAALLSSRGALIENPDPGEN